MDVANMDPQTLGDLFRGATYTRTAEDGTTHTVIIGKTDTVAFTDENRKGWQVAENIFWNYLPNLNLERAKLDAVIAEKIPNRLMTFYLPDSDKLAAVEDGNGNMWRVWADGDIEKYIR